MAENPQIMKHYRLEGGLGMMMYGAPGTGKTMFAEALANKLQLPLFIVTPADIYKSYVGASEQAVNRAELHALCAKTFYISDTLGLCPAGGLSRPPEFFLNRPRRNRLSVAKARQGLFRQGI